MHAMGGVIDMRRFGGLRKVLPITHWTFLCGAAALAGVPLLSGFWSKDEILGVVFDASSSHSPMRGVYAVLLISGLVTAGLTAFYTFRAYILTFWGEVKIPHEAGHHAHESPPIMTLPLIVLAIGAVAAGIIVGSPQSPVLQDFLREHWIRVAFTGLQAAGEHEQANYVLMAASAVIALGGIAVAWLWCVPYRSAADKFVKAWPGLYHLSLDRFYIDELYDIFIVTPITGLTVFCRIFDLYLLDGLVDLLGQVPRFCAYLFRPLQNGLVQFYALLMILGVAGFLLAVLLR